MHSSVIVIGAGIVGLATARALSLKGYKVTVIEKNEKAVGASIRNFGMVWPIGQPSGIMYNRAIRSKMIWKEVADSIGLWYDECGSLHTAYYADEWMVLQELYEHFKVGGREVELMNKRDITMEFNSVNEYELIGGLYSSSEMIVDARTAINKIPEYLNEYLNVDFVWGKSITRIEGIKAFSGSTVYEADLIFVCNGADFETLYPSIFAEQEITKCKLQMLRYSMPEESKPLGAAICGGLSLIHYKGFETAESLPVIRKRYETEMDEYIRLGIHVMVSQNEQLELTVGDSHEYGLNPGPFDESKINELITGYLKQFIICDEWKLLQSWNGVYAKMTNHATELFLQPEEGVYIINGLGGAGMTLSFGLAEELIEKI